ncbi:unnamed protein product [Tetraodon nigroviridis]|uniref:(spotted green pufferfish) hypothetical protein n=1 Tax=Tetraodon nigroviridis TaxID=99883 RepID=Q4SD46_TETNG|nr:unnamed protein product [Tetraodon nigroviridis]
MTPPGFFLLVWLLRTVISAFPEEPGPLNFIPTEVVRRHPVFLGRPHRTWLRQEPLHIQRILQVNRTLYIGASLVFYAQPAALETLCWQPATDSTSVFILSRDDLFRVELDNVAGDEMFYSKVSTNLDGHDSIYGFAVEVLFRNGRLKMEKNMLLGVIYRNAHGSPTRTISGSAG